MQGLMACEAVIFDMDGVVTDTARVHAAAWKQLFDEFLASWPGPDESARRPFEIASDYRQYVDGKPRYDGVRDFLASRGVRLPEGSPDDSPDRRTVCGLGNRKNRSFRDRLRADGARAYPSTVRLVHTLRANGIRCAVISASRNMGDVLRAAGIRGLFDARVDGVDAAELGLPGKPDPAIFLEAARRLRATVERTAVVEDAVAGVEAGRRGGFGLVVGVDRHARPAPLERAGAHVVVSDLAELEPGLRAA